MTCGGYYMCKYVSWFNKKNVSIILQFIIIEEGIFIYIGHFVI